MIADVPSEPRVEHRGESYTIVRRGRVIAQLEPAAAATALSTGRTVVTSDKLGFDDLPGLEVRRPTGH